MDDWDPPNRRQLTGKQHAFCMKVAYERMSLSAAYRAVYSAEYSKPETIHVSASRLAKDPRIAAKISELRAAVLEAFRSGKYRRSRKGACASSLR